jgi:hypothetical protein
MSNKSPARLGLLQSLVEVLVTEWGLETVQNCVQKLSSSATEDKRALSIGSDSDREKDSKSKKITAALMASRAAISNEKKALIEILAEKYDQKLFLPSAGDIKSFFEVHGEYSRKIKQRSESFRLVLRVLSNMSDATLRNIIERGIHGGPASLGPLSDAIRRVGEDRASNRASSDFVNPEPSEISSPIDGNNSN